MDKLQLKSRKKTKTHSLVVCFIGVALLLVVVILVLLYGRIEPVAIPKVQNETIIEPVAIPKTQDQTIIDNDAELLSDEQREALRQKYIAKMNVYENETKAEIEKLRLTAWSPESVAQLQDYERQAIKAFAENQFAAALRHLDNLLAKVSELQMLQKQNFQSALDNARQAFAVGDVMRASSEIDNALRYYPENQEARLLKERISTMEAIAELVKAADIAHTENNLAEEIRLLSEAIKLDSQRNDLIQRHRLLMEKQRQQNLDLLLQQASRALDDKNISAAQAALSQIRQIDAAHPSLNLLTGRLKQTQTRLSYQSLIAKAKASEQQDNWQSAENYYQQARQIFPNNKDIEDKLQLASQINQYTNTIKQALARPERLADEQISQAMKQLAEDSAKHVEHSAQIRQLIEQLDDAIAEMSKPVAVTVYSDKQTYISVMSIGVIGKVDEYRLKKGLKPGRYLFKGERKGYKDKLVEIHIKPRQSAVVRVVCDEPI